MAESFKLYIATITTKSSTSDSNKVQIISDCVSSGNRNRSNGQVAQIHSLYITQRCNNKIEGLNRYNPKYFSAFNLYVQDTSNNKTYIVFDGRITPGSPFFIEKNITLETTQSLWIECPRDSKDYDSENNVIVTLNDTSNVFLDVTASTVLFPNAD